MTIQNNDFVLNRQILRDLTKEQKMIIASVLDTHLAPFMYGEDFGTSTGDPDFADLLLLRPESGLYKNIQNRIEGSLRVKFEQLTENELSELRSFIANKEQEQEGTSFRFRP